MDGKLTVFYHDPAVNFSKDSSGNITGHPINNTGNVLYSYDEPVLTLINSSGGISRILTGGEKDIASNNTTNTYNTFYKDKEFKRPTLVNNSFKQSCISKIYVTSKALLIWNPKISIGIEIEYSCFLLHAIKSDLLIYFQIHALATYSSDFMSCKDAPENLEIQFCFTNTDKIEQVYNIFTNCYNVYFESVKDIDEDNNDNDFDSGFSNNEMDSNMGSCLGKVHSREEEEFGRRGKHLRID